VSPVNVSTADATVRAPGIASSADFSAPRASEAQPVQTSAAARLRMRVRMPIVSIG
jgi:hypothetical protein